jgi:hypothetical protein
MKNEAINEGLRLIQYLNRSVVMSDQQAENNTWNEEELHTKSVMIEVIGGLHL